jgi:hypothetical protein
MAPSLWQLPWAVCVRRGDDLLGMCQTFVLWFTRLSEVVSPCCQISPGSSGSYLCSWPTLDLREGEAVPENVDPARVVWIKRTYVDPPERGEETLPEGPQEAAGNVFGADRKRPERFNRPIEYQPVRIV